MVLYWRRYGRAGGCQIKRGGVAQLGEHLPCKQGVKSSNLSVSIESEMIYVCENTLNYCTLKTTHWNILNESIERLVNIQDIRGHMMKIIC